MVDTIVDAQKIIQNYASDSLSNQLPTVSDYENMGVTGVTTTNLDTLNEIVAATYSSYVNTVAEVQSLVDNL